MVETLTTKPDVKESPCAAAANIDTATAGEPSEKSDSLVPSSNPIARAVAANGPMLERLKHEAVQIELSCGQPDGNGKKTLSSHLEMAVAVVIPYIYREVILHGHGTPDKPPIKLPDQVSACAWGLILDYCRYHSVRGRSDKERQIYDEKFTRMDSSKLCELTSAAHALEFTPLVDLGSKGIARLIRGKNPQQIRDLFNLPDDLSEEEKLEPLPAGWGPLDTRVRLLNNLNAKKLQQLQAKKDTVGGTDKDGKAASSNISTLPALLLPPTAAGGGATTATLPAKDDRPIEELLDFIEAPASSSGKSKSKNKKKANKATTPAKTNPGEQSAPNTSNGPANGTTSPTTPAQNQKESVVNNNENDLSIATRSLLSASNTTSPAFQGTSSLAMTMAVPQVSLIDDFNEIADLGELSSDEDDDELDPLQAYLLNLALMRQQAPITTLTSLSQFKPRQAAASQEESGSQDNESVAELSETGSMHLQKQRLSQGDDIAAAVVEPTAQGTASTAPSSTQEESRDIKAVEKPAVVQSKDEVASIKDALSRFFAACGLDESLKVDRKIEIGQADMPSSEVLMRVSLPQAGGTLEFSWKPN